MRGGEAAGRLRGGRCGAGRLRGEGGEARRPQNTGPKRLISAAAQDAAPRFRCTCSPLSLAGTQRLSHARRLPGAIAATVYALHTTTPLQNFTDCYCHCAHRLILSTTRGTGNYYALHVNTSPFFVIGVYVFPQFVPGLLTFLMQALAMETFLFTYSNHIHLVLDSASES